MHRLVIKHGVETYVSYIGNTALVEWADTCDVMDGSHEAGRIAYLARPVSGSRPIAYATVIRHANQGDVESFEAFSKWRAHESGYIHVAWLSHWPILFTRNNGLLDIMF